MQFKFLVPCNLYQYSATHMAAKKGITKLGSTKHEQCEAK
uniref:Uncharacterized protein n=1 Tax=Arundo donax TaxID=35708 RepID=A0A0A9BNQ4_ARUDO